MEWFLFWKLLTSKNMGKWPNWPKPSRNSESSFELLTKYHIRQGLKIQAVTLCMTMTAQCGPLWDLFPCLKYIWRRSKNVHVYSQLGQISSYLGLLLRFLRYSGHCDELSRSNPHLKYIRFYIHIKCTLWC